MSLLPISLPNTSSSYFTESIVWFACVWSALEMLKSPTLLQGNFTPIFLFQRLFDFPVETTTLRYVSSPNSTWCLLFYLSLQGLYWLGMLFPGRSCKCLSNGILRECRLLFFIQFDLIWKNMFISRNNNNYLTLLICMIIYLILNYALFDIKINAVLFDYFPFWFGWNIIFSIAIDLWSFVMSTCFASIVGLTVVLLRMLCSFLEQGFAPIFLFFGIFSQHYA